MPATSTCRRRSAGGSFDHARPERGVATLTLAIGVLVLLGATAAVAVATDGFGRNAEPTSSPAPDATGPEGPEPDRGPDASATATATATNGENLAASPMEAAFAAGRSVVCTYTYEAYDATTTLRSKDAFRIDQQTQGGLAHVIRGPRHTQVWADGMTEAMEFDTTAYEQAPAGAYPTFDPAEFDIEALFDDGTCQPVAEAADAVLELPADMSSAPGTP